MTRLLISQNVMPEWQLYLEAFGLKDFPMDEGYSGLDTRFSKDNDGRILGFGRFVAPVAIVKCSSMPEVCYLFKYVECHNESQAAINPWQIRQMAIYQKYDLQSRRSIDQIIRISNAMQQGVKRILPTSRNELQTIFDWESLHLTCFGSVLKNWRQFINYLDREISKMVPEHAHCIKHLKALADPL